MDLIQWNMNGYSVHRQELQVIISKFTPAVLCLQETQLRPDHEFTVYGYTTYHDDSTMSTGAHGGTVKYV
jgi:exonuclease III